MRERSRHHPLGAQLWVERDDSPERIDHLVSTARAAGLDQLRVFLMWNWMQPERDGPFDFGLYDAVFDSALRHGIGIKATLTANSGPWWTGAPDVLHTFTLTLDRHVRPAMAAYIRAVVDRYRDHPALEQWILWNEPINPVGGKDGPPERTAEARAEWTRVLREQYETIDDLNRRWRTGYRDWDEVPFAGDTTAPAHRDSLWRGFAPHLLDYRLRSRILVEELTWIGDEVRRGDPDTPMCVNPNGLFHNHADAGYDLRALASTVDVLGASFHAPWSFTYAPRGSHLGLLAAGVGLIRAIGGDHETEVTEMQIGNTYYAGDVPMGITRQQVAASYLTAVFAGASSATGWSLNTRQQDFEAGEWGLLDSTDGIGDRARGASDARRVLDVVGGALPGWRAAASGALVLVDEPSEAVEQQMALSEDPATGRGPATSIRGSSLLVAEFLLRGTPATLAGIDAVARSSAPLIVVSHLLAWPPSLGDHLIERAHEGATVVVDATSGHFDDDARRWSPGPGRGTSEWGAHFGGLESPYDGTAQFDLELHATRLRDVASVRADWVLEDGSWRPATGLRFEDDESPVVWARGVGRGRIVFSRISLAATALRTTDSARLALRTVLAAVDNGIRPVAPAGANVIVLPLESDARPAWAVLSTRPSGGGIRSSRVEVAPGRWRDLVSDRGYEVGADGALTIQTEESVAVITPE